MQKPEMKDLDLQFVRGLSERLETNRIIIHHVGEIDRDVSAAEIHDWHLNNGWSGIGYHFVIRKDGTIELGRPDWAIGAHAEWSNHDSIGICVVGDFMTAVPTDEQIESLSYLIAWIGQEYGIELSRSTVQGHREVCSTDCPGDNLYALLEDGNDEHGCTVIGKAIYYQNKGDD